jgi:outer membrane immunogenic protein
VYGLEAAGDWVLLTGTATCFAGDPNQGIAGQDCATTVGALATFAGRIGYAADRTLYYAKAGPALGRTAFKLNFAGADPGVSQTAVANRWGFAVGGGVEHALTREWSIVGEYKYVDLGTATARFGAAPDELEAVATERVKQNYHVLTLGLNYKLY